MKYDLIKPLNPSYSFIEQIFYNRNVSDIDSFINPSVSSLHDEFLLDNISRACELLLSHLQKRSKIFIQVDSDCDGYTSSAILLNWIYNFDKVAYENIVFRIHDGKQHGIMESSLEEFKQNEIKLVIIPDAGSNQIQIHQQLADLGIDCIVIDHHESDFINSPAIIVNPKLDSYPNKELSGAGVVYKFCKALDKHTSSRLADNFLDLVALGMIADMMNVTELETRRLIITGIYNIKNDFFKALIKKQAYSMRNEVTPTTIGFYVAPLINATVRAGTAEEKDLIFNAFLESNRDKTTESARNGVEPLFIRATRIVTNIKSRQTKMRDKSIERIQELIESQGLNNNKIITVVVDEEIDRNLSGLIANKLLGIYKKPVIILKKNEENFLRGSARGHGLEDFKDFINKTEMVEYAEGHAGAFGISIREENINSFVEHTNKQLESYDFDNKYLVDYIFTNNSIKEDFIFQIHELRNLWGKGFEEPLFCLENLKFKKDDIILLSPDKNPTIKLVYKNISFIKFRASLEEYNNLLPQSGEYIEMNIVGRFSINEWNNTTYPQILIEDYEKKRDIKYFF